jgi:curved DNA-binding protein CbpA
MIILPHYDKILNVVSGILVMPQEALIIQGVGLLLREDPVFVQAWQKTAPPSPVGSLSYRRKFQLDSYLNRKLSGHWFSSYFYAWYHGITDLEIRQYIISLLTRLRENQLILNKLSPGERAVFNTLRSGLLSSLRPYLSDSVWITYSAFQQLRVAPQSWFHRVDESVSKINTWLFKNQPRYRPIVTTSTGGHYLITIKGTTVHSQTLKNAVIAYESIPWWNLIKKWELKKTYPFNILKFAQAWDFHWINTLQNDQQEVENKMFMAQTKKAQQTWSLSYSDLLKDIYQETADVLRDDLVAYCTVENNNPELTFNGKSYQTKSLFLNYQTKANAMLRDLVRLVSSSQEDISLQYKELEKHWNFLQEDHQKICKALSLKHPELLQYFKKSSSTAQMGWSKIYVYCLQKQGISGEIAERFEALKQHVNHYSELRPSNNWFKGGDHSPYSVWIEKHHELSHEIKALKELLGEYSELLDVLDKLAHDLNVIHVRVQEQCADYVDNQSKTGQLVVVPQCVPNLNSNEIPLEQREYSYRAISSYSTLKLPVGASLDEIKAAYKKLAIRNHPDKFPLEEREQAERQFKEIGKANSYLSHDKGYLHYIRKLTFDPKMYAQDYIAWYEECKSIYDDAVIYREHCEKISTRLDAESKIRLEIFEQFTKLKPKNPHPDDSDTVLQFFRKSATLSDQHSQILQRNSQIGFDIINLESTNKELRADKKSIHERDILKIEIRKAIDENCKLNEKEMKQLEANLLLFKTEVEQFEKMTMIRPTYVSLWEIEIKKIIKTIAAEEREKFEATLAARYTPSYSDQMDNNHTPDNANDIVETSQSKLKANQL